MTRKSSFVRVTRPTYFRSRLERLEDRRLLSGDDLLIAQLEPGGGKSVLRYDDAYASTPGSVPYLDHGLATATGLVVVPDGSFYVSSADFVTFQGKVLHYSHDGQYLGELGENDAFPATIVVPGTLVYGNGKLYVGDLGAGVVYKFDITSNTQQWLGAETNVISFTPGGMAFAADADLDGTHDLIVADIDSGAINRYNNDNSLDSVPLASGSGVNASSIIVKPNSDMILADFSLALHATDHHRIMTYDASASPGNQLDLLVDLTSPVGTGDAAGDPPQPSAILLDHDGNLLIGLSPDHNFNGAIQKYDFTTQALTTLISNIGTPTGLAFVPGISSVAERNVFYNNSFYDDNANDPGNLNDDTAIATDKSAYLPGSGTSGFANYTTYDKGINGVMVDLSPGGNHAALTAADFTFKMSAQGISGQSSDPTDGSWNTPVPAPTVIYRPAGTAVPVQLGYAGNVLPNDRIELVWADNAIKDRWLEVVVKANANTGLAAQDVFFYGNMPGDTNDDPSGDFKTIDANDQFNIKTAATDPNNTGLYFTYALSSAISNLWDINRDGDVNASDQFAAKQYSLSPYGQLDTINIPIGGPFAPSSGGGAAVASALAGAGGSSSNPGGSWIANRLASLESTSGSTASYFAGLMADDSSDDESSDDDSDDASVVSDELLDALLA